jgi:hypothetical protein
MSHALVFVIANRATKRMGLQPFLEALESTWNDVAPRHRGIAPRWGVTVSLPPTHKEANRILKISPQGIPNVLEEWICIITQDSGLDLLGSDDHLSSIGMSFIRDLWSRLARFHPTNKIGLWCALRSGSGWSSQLKMENACIRPIENLKYPPNTIVILNDSTPTAPASSHSDNLEVASSVNLSPTSANRLKEITSTRTLDPRDLNGTIDTLTGDHLIRLGQPNESLLLLPSLKQIADGINQLRTAGTSIEIVPVGDTTSIWLVRSLKDMSHVHLVHGATRTNAISTRALDNSFKEATAEFLARTIDALPLSRWPEHARVIFNQLTIAWPELEAFRVL